MLGVEFAVYPGVGPPRRQHRIKEGHEVLPHVRVGTVANSQFPRPELRARLQHRTQDVAACARHCWDDAWARRLRFEARVDVHDVERLPPVRRRFRRW